MNLKKDLKVEVVTINPELRDRAVKVTHIWTGLSATCGTQRSTLGNMRVATAMVAEGLVTIGYKGPQPLNEKPATIPI